MKTKTKLTLALLLAGIVFTSTWYRPKVQAEPMQARAHATAILYLYDDAQGHFYIGQFSVAGAGLPQIKIGDPAADVINSLRDAGLRINPQTSPLFFVLTR